jgi:hypothetical protein
MEGVVRTEWRWVSESREKSRAVSPFCPPASASPDSPMALLLSTQAFRPMSAVSYCCEASTLWATNAKAHGLMEEWSLRLPSYGIMPCEQVGFCVCISSTRRRGRVVYKPVEKAVEMILLWWMELVNAFVCSTTGILFMKELTRRLRSID